MQIMDDSDSDDDVLQQTLGGGRRRSSELRALDRRLVLGAEAEVNRLVAAARGQKMDDDDDDDDYDDDEDDEERKRRQTRRSRRAAEKARLVAEAARGGGTLLYAMEEGGLKEGSTTGSSERGDDDEEEEEEEGDGLLEKKRQGRGRGPAARSKTSWRWALVYAAVVVVAFVLLGVGAWRLSTGRRRERPHRPHKDPRPSVIPPLVSNGSALFGPTTLIISLDGFRADFLDRGLTPRLAELMAAGVAPPYMRPSFPSVTFPNHYTLVTGLHPESHGVVGNTFWDPARGDGFVSTDPTRSLDARWWEDAEPLWVTAERAGVRTAMHMWPGSEAAICGEPPTYVDRYNGEEALGKKVDRILELLDKPGFEVVDAFDSGDHDGLSPGDGRRPQFIAAYVPNVDADGHRFGPNSTELDAALQAVDGMLGGVLDGLAARNLSGIVNVVVVSDHGMATTNTSRLLQLEDLVGGDAAFAQRVAHVDGWPLVGLRPRTPEDLEVLFREVVHRTADHPHYHVYLRDADADADAEHAMPPRFHFSQNPRIAPLWIVPEPGWGLVARAEFDVAEAAANGIAYHPRGLHGYDNAHPLMRAIFVARGPAFAGARAPARLRAPFQNTEVYNLLCDSLGVEPKANNGTIRLGETRGETETGAESATSTTGTVSTKASTKAESAAESTATSTTTSRDSTATSTTTTRASPTPVSKATQAATPSSSPHHTAHTDTSTPAQATDPATGPVTQPGDDMDSPDSSNSDPPANASPVDQVVGAAHDVWAWLTDHVGAAWDKWTGGGDEGEGEGDDDDAAGGA